MATEYINATINVAFYLKKKKKKKTTNLLLKSDSLKGYNF